MRNRSIYKLAAFLIMPGLVFAAVPSDSNMQKQLLELKEQNRELKLDMRKLSKSYRVQSSVLQNYRRFAGDRFIEVNALNKVDTGKTGFNASNPSWSPDGAYLSFDRSDQTSREIVIMDKNNTIIHSVSYEVDEDMAELDSLLPELSDNTYFNTGISWSSNSKDFVYVSNGTEGNYDLYQGNITNGKAIRLTTHDEKEGHARWSPTRNEIVFVSGRTGNANLFIINLTNKKVHQITHSKQSSIYPDWRPTGNHIVFTHGKNLNHDIAIIENSGGKSKISRLVSSPFDDVRPVWSMDGSKIAFYTNIGTDQGKWSLVVIPYKENTPTIKNLDDYIVADNVIPNIETGPSWTRDSQSIVYVKKDEKNFNPIHIVNTQSGVDALLMTNTRINNDINISSKNELAFRSQLNQWDTVYKVTIPGSK